MKCKTCGKEAAKRDKLFRTMRKDLDIATDVIAQIYTAAAEAFIRDYPGEPLPEEADFALLADTLRHLRRNQPKEGH